MFYAVVRWNEYLRSGVYISKLKDSVLQVVLRKFLVEGDTTTLIGAQNLLNYNELAKIDYTALSYAVIVIAIIPILVLFPLVLKYYTKDVMAGGVKG
jgi:putative aldouronate transport system permease protein